MQGGRPERQGTVRVTWDKQGFKRAYLAAGGTPNGAAGYVAYLNRADAMLGGIDERLGLLGVDATVEAAEQAAVSCWGGAKPRSDSLAALRRYASGATSRETIDDRLPVATAPPLDLSSAERVALLREAQALGARYYAATGKPLGVTGEVAELEAADKLGLELCPPRTAGYDALDRSVVPPLRVQVKGRAIDPADRYRGRCPSITCGDLFDTVVLVLLDRTTLAAIEIWEATETAVAARLAVPGSKARNERKSLAIAQFKSIARQVWP